MNFFENELQKRINPEISRNFKSYFWIENLSYLEEIYFQIESFFSFRPIKISIVGTNGKGSIAYFLSQLFYKEGYNVGLYTSPHLRNYRERILINLQQPTEEFLSNEYKDFLRFISNFKFKKNIFDQLTFFELLTIFSIFLFYKMNLKIHIYEAGLGGRLDATKIVNPDVVILTTIRLDHTKILGNLYSKILTEKLGILSKNTKKLLVLEPRLKNQIELYLEKHQIKTALYFYPNHQKKNIDYIENLKQASIFCYKNIIDKEPPSIELIPPLGRREIHKINNQYYCFDIAHNPSGVYFFLLSLKETFKDLDKENSNIFLAILKDRNYKHFFRLFNLTKLREIFEKPYILGFPEFAETKHYQYRIVNFNTIDEFKNWNHNKKYIILCGSSRLYEFYYKLTQNENIEKGSI